MSADLRIILTSLKSTLEADGPALSQYLPYVEEALAAESARAQDKETEPTAFQSRVKEWSLQCFGPLICSDKTERCDRFLEEALELVQSIGYSPDRAHALTDYVFNRPLGDTAQETGGVMVTLAALCAFNDLDMVTSGETELARVWGKINQIRAKQAAKPPGSALPIAVPAKAQDELPLNNAVLAKLLEATGCKHEADLIAMAKAGLALVKATKTIITEARTGDDLECDSWDNLQGPAEIVRLLYQALLDETKEKNDAVNELNELQDEADELRNKLSGEHTQIRRIYQDIADDNKQDALHGLYEAFGTECGLHNPATQARLTDLLSTTAKASV